jgi:hypothetical protein
VECYGHLAVEDGSTGWRRMRSRVAFHLCDLDFVQELCGEDGRDCWLSFLQMSSL